MAGTGPGELAHGTAIAVNGAGVLLLGASHAGKSDLAFRAITQPVAINGQSVRVQLLSDDQVQLERIGDRIVARSPAPLRGLIELRGLGIVTVEASEAAPLALVIRLKPTALIERLPEADTYDILGLQIPLISLDPEKPSSAARIVVAALGLVGDIGVARP